MTIPLIALIAVVVVALLFGCVYWIYKRYRPEPKVEPPPPYPETPKRAINETELLISFASQQGRSKPLDKGDVHAVLDAQKAGNSITAAQEAAFWASASSIAAAVSPVTIESLQSSSAFAVLAARKYRVHTIVTLVLLLIFQVYWLIGAAIVSDLQAIRPRLEKLRAESYTIRAAQSASNQEAPDNKIKSDESLKQDEFDSRLFEERVSAWADLRALRNWDVTKIIYLATENNIAPPVLQAPPAPGEGNKSAPPALKPPEPRKENEIDPSAYFLWVFTPEAVQDLQRAQIILTALLKYILPILYGMLGASARIVRTLEAEIKDFTYSRSSTTRYELRFYLGAVAGLSVAWFTSDPKSSETAGVLQSLSPLAVAFLAGYSVELLFSLLDRLVSAFSGPEPKRVP